MWNDRGYNIIGKPARPFLPGKKEQIIGFDQTLSTDDEENEKKNEPQTENYTEAKHSQLQWSIGPRTSEGK